MKKYILFPLIFFSFILLSQDSNKEYSYSELLELGYDFVYEKGDYQSANHYFTQAIKMNPDIPFAYYGRAIGYRLGLDFEAENTDSVYNCLDLALIDQNKALELLSKKEKELKGSVYSEIGILQLLKDEGDYCASFKKACKYKDANGCDTYESLCKE